MTCVTMCSVLPQRQLRRPIFSALYTHVAVLGAAALRGAGRKRSCTNCIREFHRRRRDQSSGGRCQGKHASLRFGCISFCVRVQSGGRQFKLSFSKSRNAASKTCEIFVQVRISKHLTDLEQMFYGASLSYDKASIQAIIAIVHKCLNLRY